MTISSSTGALERATFAGPSRELLRKVCSEEEFQESIRKLEAGGSEAEDDWLCFHLLMAKISGQIGVNSSPPWQPRG